MEKPSVKMVAASLIRATEQAIAQLVAERDFVGLMAERFEPGSAKRAHYDAMLERRTAELPEQLGSLEEELAAARGVLQGELDKEIEAAKAAAAAASSPTNGAPQAAQKAGAA